MRRGWGLCDGGGSGGGGTVGAASQLAFTTVPRNLIAGRCPGASNGISVQLQDFAGNPVNAPAGGQALTATSSSTGTVTWFANDTCTLSAGNGDFTVPLGSDSVSLFYIDTAAGMPAISLTNLSGLSNPTAQLQTVAAGPPTVLAFTTAAVTVDATTCSPTAIALQTRDAWGNPANVSSNVTVGLGAAPLSLVPSFSVLPTCGSPLTSVQVLNGTHQSAFFFSADNPGAMTVTASANGFAAISQVETVSAAPLLSRVVLTPTLGPAEAGHCTPMRVLRMDSAGRLVTPAFATPVSLAASPSVGLQLFSNVFCTLPISTVSIAAGSAVQDFFFKGITGSTTYVLTASSAGLSDVMTNIVVLPMVRRGTCQIAAGASTVSCPVTLRPRSTPPAAFTSWRARDSEVRPSPGKVVNLRAAEG